MDSRVGGQLGGDTATELMFTGDQMWWRETRLTGDTRRTDDQAMRTYVEPTGDRVTDGRANRLTAAGDREDADERPEGLAGNGMKERATELTTQQKGDLTGRTDWLWRPDDRRRLKDERVRPDEPRGDEADGWTPYRVTRLDAVRRSAGTIER